MNLSPEGRSVSVIVPVFNNSVSLPSLFSRLTRTLEALGLRFEIIFVDDGSTDDSLKILRSIADSDERCLALSLSRNFGQHPAIRAGLSRASGSITVLMDADLQDAPEEIPRLVEALDDSESDIAFTVFDPPRGLRHRFTSRLFHKVYSRLSGVKVPLNVGTYRAFSEQIRNALLEYPERNAVYGPLMAQMGFAHQFVRVNRGLPVGRQTSYSFRRRLSLAISAIISYGTFVPRFVIWIGSILTILSGTYLLIATSQYLAGNRSLGNGQLLLLVITLLVSGVLLTIVGVLTAFTYRIFEEVLARPPFHVAREYGRGLSRAPNEARSTSI